MEVAQNNPPEQQPVDWKLTKKTSVYRAIAAIAVVFHVLSALDAFVSIFMLNFFVDHPHHNGAVAVFIFFAILLMNALSVAGIYHQLAFDLAFIVGLAIANSAELMNSSANTLGYMLLHVMVLWSVGQGLICFVVPTRPAKKPTHATVVGALISIPVGAGLLFAFWGGWGVTRSTVINMVPLPVAIIGINGSIVEAKRAGCGAAVPLAIAALISNTGKAVALAKSMGNEWADIGVVVCLALSLLVCVVGRISLQSSRQVESNEKLLLGLKIGVTAGVGVLLGATLPILWWGLRNVFDQEYLYVFLDTLGVAFILACLHLFICLAAWSHSTAASGVAFILMFGVLQTLSTVTLFYWIWLLIVVVWLVLDTIICYKLQQSQIQKPIFPPFPTNKKKIIWTGIVAAVTVLCALLGSIFFGFAYYNDDYRRLQAFMIPMLSGWPMLIPFGLPRIALRTCFYGLDVMTFVIFTGFSFTPLLVVAESSGTAMNGVVVMFPFCLLLFTYTGCIFLVTRNCAELPPPPLEPVYVEPGQAVVVVQQQGMAAPPQYPPQPLPPQYQPQPPPPQYQTQPPPTGDDSSSSDDESRPLAPQQHALHPAQQYQPYTVPTNGNTQFPTASIVA